MLRNIHWSHRLSKITARNPSQEELGSLLEHYQNARYEDAEKLALSITQEFPDHPYSWTILGVLLEETGRASEALNANQRAVQLEPQAADGHYNLANTFRTLGRLEEAEASYLQALALAPEDAGIYYNLGVTLQGLERLEESRINYKQATTLKSDYAEAHYGLGILYHEQKIFKNAAKHFILADNYADSQNYVLRHYFTTNQKDNFHSQLDKMINQGLNNAVIGSLIMTSEIKYGTKKNNIFCKNPMQYVLIKDLTKELDFKNIFVDTAKIIIENQGFKNQPLLTNGQQSSGNFFDIKKDFVKKIENIIILEIEKYRDKFKDSDEGFIKNWPAKFELNGWYISMKNGGSLRSHMHESGWLSGSIYINIPKKNKKNSGNLVLDNGIKSQEKNIDIRTGNLCLFPASLHHYTIPFESQEDRIVLAFDVNPKT